jgi:hypothetical protein
MTTTQERAGRLEVRSIDYVPLNERHGKIWHLGPLWFTRGEPWVSMGPAVAGPHRHCRAATAAS